MSSLSRRDALRAGMVSTAIVGGATVGATAYAPAASAAPTGEGWISVLDHGAVGDGTTDDTAAIQAGLNAAAATNPSKGIYFPAGRIFKVSNQLTATGLTDCVISGYGATLALAGAATSANGAKAVFQLRGCCGSRCSASPCATPTGSSSTTACGSRPHGPSSWTL